MKTALAALVCAGVAGTGQAATPDPIGPVLCAPTAELRQKLERQFGARRAGTGWRSPEQVLELWASPQDGDWTLVIAYASGRSCIVAFGEHWDATRPEPG